jgi:hypothetical protein
MILELEHELAKLVADLAPGLLGIYGCSTLTAANILAESGGIHRFKSKAAYGHRSVAARDPAGAPTRHRFGVPTATRTRPVSRRWSTPGGCWR